MTYDPGSPGALCYLEAAREIADQGSTPMNASRPPQRRGLGRGLGSLIPTAPAQPAPCPAGRVPSGSTSAVAPSEVASADGSTGGSGTPGPDAAATAGPGAVDGLAPVAGAYFAELPVGADHAQPRASPARSSTRRRWPSWSTRSARSACCSRSWCAAPATRPTSWSWASAAGAPPGEAGLETIPAIVRETDDNDMLRDALLENLHRSQLNPLEEAAAYQQLLEDFGCTHDELAGRIGRSRPQISNTLRLLRSRPAVQRRVAAGVLSAGHARALLGVEDPERQDQLAQRVVAEGISVRGLEEIVAVGEPDAAGDPRHRGASPSAPGLVDIADRLSDRFETRVKVDLGKAKGKITVEFATLDDLQRIVDVMDPRNRTDRVDLVALSTRHFVDKAIGRLNAAGRRTLRQPGRLTGAAPGPSGESCSRPGSHAAGSTQNRASDSGGGRGGRPAPRRRAGRPRRGWGRSHRGRRAATSSRGAARRPGRRRWSPRASSPSAPAARAVSPTGSTPVGWNGSPTRIAIVLPREKSRGWSLVIIRCVPHRITGTIGTPASAAMRTAPVLNSLSSKEREMVASGKIPTASPALR